MQKTHLLKMSMQAIDFFDEYTSRASEARRQTKKRIGLKILSPKQMLQRLAGNNSNKGR